MVLTVCPDSVDLERLFLGGLSGPDLETVEQHVLKCASCVARLKALFLAKDNLAGVLREETRSDAFDPSPAVNELMRKLEALPGPLAQGSPMIAFSCPGCQKRLSVNENLAGKRVQCPACGQVVPVLAGVAAGPAGSEEPQAWSPAGAVDPLTDPPLSQPDATVGVPPPAGPDASLTEFLAPPQAADELGRLGKYRILKILGRGGMGVVFQGEDPRLKRSVALKAMLPALAASESAGQRFLREAQAMAAVEHDHIVRIYQVDEDRGVPYMAMEFLKGEPLDERLRRDGKLPVFDVLRIGREIAAGLSAAHTSGLIHRDIKPGNIWLEAPKSRVKILDFGLARPSDAADGGLTHEGAILGTPAYMAPEQARGETVDPRCDLFSLGVVLYRLCSGRQPFVGDDPLTTIMAVTRHEPVAPKTIDPELPQELSDLIMKLLAKDPAQRIPSAAVVVEVLNSIEKALLRAPEATDRTEAVIIAPPRRAVAPGRRAVAGRPSKAPPRRRLVVVLGAAAAALVLAVAGLVLFWQTPSGTVRIEINDPKIQVAFDKRDLIFTGVDKQDLKVSPGAYGLHVKRANLEFDTDKPIVINKGDLVTLRVEWLKDGKLQVVQGEKVIGARTIPPRIVGVEHVKPEESPASPVWSLDFDDNGRVNLPSLALNVDEPLTAEAWVTPRVQTSKKLPLVFAVDWIRQKISVTKNKWQVTVPQSSPLYTSPSRSFMSDQEFSPGKRTHLAAVWSGKGLSFYVNGQQQTQHDNVTVAKDFDRRFVLGDKFQGQIHQFRVSKARRYQGRIVPISERFDSDDRTLILYRFDEGQGDKLTDASGNGHHGKIVGARWVKADGTPTMNAPGPWQPLLDAKLSHWNLVVNNAGTVTATVSDGEPVMRLTQNAHASTKKWFQNYHLRLEFQFPGNDFADFQVGRTGKGFGINFGIDSKGTAHRWLSGVRGNDAVLEHGAIVVKGAAQAGTVRLGDVALAPAGGWNRLDLVRVEDRLAYFINGRFLGALADVRLLKDGAESALGRIPACTPMAYRGVVLLRRVEVRDIHRFRPELIAPGPWQPLLDASLTKWGKSSEVAPNAVATLQSEGETVLRLTRAPKVTGAWVSSKERVRDHHLRLEFRFTGKGPGAIYCGYRWKKGTEGMIQLQIAYDGKARRVVKGTRFHEALLADGAIASTGADGQNDVKLPDLFLQPAGAWNRLDLVRIGDGAACFINGRCLIALAHVRDVTDGKEAELANVGIMTAGGPGDVLVRRIEIRDISALPSELLANAPFPPLDPAWLQKVAALPAKEQVEWVKGSLMKRNPGFDGDVTPVIDKAGVVTGLTFLTDNVTDISPVRALTRLRTLTITGRGPHWKERNGKLADLSPLKGMKLAKLYLTGTNVADLSPLKGMKLTFLSCWYTQVSDLSPLKDMALVGLDCRNAKVTDLSPLREMPLRNLSCDYEEKRDAAILRSITTLETINSKDARAFLK